ncbi:hypothetical protein LPJ73_003559 [Coemansia sp. RSA 2703]|nr:hypothetical protein LPJ73_003559 [Coemansia sp. RSA 2703]KAJ2374990.1 hypothetical protein IW150_002797 [Coemansia sp. RSA 2607]
MVPQQLNIDIKERISYVACKHSIARSRTTAGHTTAQQFTQLAFTLTHVDRAWRHAGLKHAWHTVYLTTPTLDPLIPTLLLTHGAHHTQRLVVKVHFKSILSHYRRHKQVHKECEPFSSLKSWRALRELEIEYMHFCAFPGLPAYLQPRLQGVSRLTVRGRVPGDMRRAVMFLHAPGLQHVGVEGEPDGSLVVETIGNTLLVRRLGASITSLRLTTLIDIGIVCAILSNTSPMRTQLRKLALYGFTPAQLAAIELTLATRNTPESPGRVWHNLHTLVLTVNLATDDPAITLDASEFPHLFYLCIHRTQPYCSQDSVTYAQTFAKPWRALAHVHLAWASAEDVCLVGHAVTGLRSLHVEITDSLLAGSAVCRMLTGLPLLQWLVLGSRSAADVADAELRARNIWMLGTHVCSRSVRSSGTSMALRVLHVDTELSDTQVAWISARCPRLREIRYATPSDKGIVSESVWYSWPANAPGLVVALDGDTGAVPR